MDVDQKTLERIAGALERIATVLESLSPANAAILKSTKIVAAVKGLVSQTSEAVGSAATLSSTIKVPSGKQGQPGEAKASGTPAKKASATKTAPVTKPVAKKSPTASENKAKTKLAKLRKTRAGQQLSDFFVKLGLTILNPDAIEPKVEHQKLANAIWQGQRAGFDLMGDINSAIHRKTIHTVDWAQKTKAEKASITSLCGSLKKKKMIQYEEHDNQIDITPLDDKTNYISGRWGEDVILTRVLKVAAFLNNKQDKPVCSVFRSIDYKKNGSDKWIDSECDLVLVVNGKFYFIEVKTGKQLNTEHYVEQVGHLEDKKEYSIYCCIDKEKAPEEIKSLCVKSNFAIFDFEHFDASLKALITKRQSYSFETGK